MNPTILSYKVEVTDLDYMGIVAHYKWVEIFEKTRFAMLESRGWPLSKAWETGVGAVIAEINVRFLRKVKYGETLSVEITPCRAFEGGCWLEYKVFNGDRKMVAESDQKAVFIEMKTGKTTKIPSDLAEIFEL